MKHSSQVGYADILVLFFYKELIMGWKMGNTRIIVIYFNNIRENK